MNQKNSHVFWITGLSGSGKSTLSTLLTDYYRNKGLMIVKLDGDELRSIFGPNISHDRNSRLELAARYSRLCRMLSRQGVNVAISTISLFHEIHEWNREHIPGYIEIFLDVPIDELKRRDPKKIYERAESGELSNVAGIDLKVEYPLNPDITLKFSPNKNPDTNLTTIINQFDL